VLEQEESLARGRHVGAGRAVVWEVGSRGARRCPSAGFAIGAALRCRADGSALAVRPPISRIFRRRIVLSQCPHTHRRLVHPRRMLAASRRAAQRTTMQQRQRVGAMLEPISQLVASRAPAQKKVEWDGTRPAGWCSGFIHDGRSGFYEHQPGFLRSRARC